MSDMGNTSVMGSKPKRDYTAAGEYWHQGWNFDTEIEALDGSKCWCPARIVGVGHHALLVHDDMAREWAVYRHHEIRLRSKGD